MIQIKEFQNGFKYLEISTPYSQAKIALQGAHIFEFTPLDAQDILWVSEASKFEYGKSIRGGIPICWPWFGMHKSNKQLPQHGFARIALWEFIDAQEKQDSTQITLKLQSMTETKKMFEYEFELTLIVEVGKELHMQLITKNTDSKAFSITQALHSYFRISDIQNISIEGLKNKSYLDALDFTHKVQTQKLQIDKEVDRVFFDTHSEIQLLDAQRKISIKRKGSASVVVWNPWIKKCARMSGMEKESYKTFVCIESANAMADKKEIKPNEQHILETQVSFF